MRYLEQRVRPNPTDQVSSSLQESRTQIVLHHRDDLLRQARRDWAATPELREKYRKFRPNVERVISQIASRGGRRLKLRYRGTEKNNAWLTRRTAGLNLRNLVGRGLTHTAGSGFWRPRPPEKGTRRPRSAPPPGPTGPKGPPSRRTEVPIALQGAPIYLRVRLPPISRLGPFAGQSPEPLISAPS